MVSDWTAGSLLTYWDVVLILVLMEYGLWRGIYEWETKGSTVLILVLMEYGLWQTIRQAREICSVGLNPCSNGIWSLTVPRMRDPRLAGLNPCSNGIWSLTAVTALPPKPNRVLILVLMEYGLWRIRDARVNRRNCVLILVLMEYGLWLNWLLHSTN